MDIYKGRLRPDATDEQVVKVGRRAILVTLLLGIGFGFAFAYIKLQEFDKAESDYDELIKLRPDDASAYYNRAVTHAAEGDMTSALADYTSAIWLGYDDSYKAFYNRGTIYESQGDFESAVADFKEAYKLAPDEPRIREKLEALNRQQ